MLSIFLQVFYCPQKGGEPFSVTVTYTQATPLGQWQILL